MGTDSGKMKHILRNRSADGSVATCYRCGGYLLGASNKTCSCNAYPNKYLNLPKGALVYIVLNKPQWIPTCFLEKVPFRLVSLVTAGKYSYYTVLVCTESEAYAKLTKEEKLRINPHSGLDVWAVNIIPVSADSSKKWIFDRE